MVKKAKTIEEEKLQATYLDVVGKDPNQPYLLINVSDSNGDPESIASKLYIVPFNEEEVNPIPVYQYPSWFTSMSMSPSGKIFIVDADGYLHYLKGKNCKKTNISEDTFLMDIWSANDKENFIVGEEGTLIYLNENTKSIIKDKKKRNFNAVHGISTKNVLAVGDKGALWHFNGKIWEELKSPTKEYLLAVLYVSETEQYIAGSKGTLFMGSLQKDFWKKIKCSTKLNITSLAWYKNELYIAAGEYGVFKLVENKLENFSSSPVDTLSVISNRLFASKLGFVGYWTKDGWWGGDLNFVSG